MKKTNAMILQEFYIQISIPLYLIDFFNNEQFPDLLLMMILLITFLTERVSDKNYKFRAGKKILVYLIYSGRHLLDFFCHCYFHS